MADQLEGSGFPIKSTDGRADLLEVEDPFRLMVESVIDYGVLMLDLQGRVVTWNRGAELINGYKAAEIIGQHFSVFYPAVAIADGVPRRELSIAATDQQYRTEGWRVRKDGSQFWAGVVVIALRDTAGRLVGYGKLTRDLTERCRVEQEVRGAQERLQLMVEAVSDYAMYVLDPFGVVATWNRGAERIKGYRAGEIIGKHFSVFYSPEAIEGGLPEKGLKVAAETGRYEEEGWRVRKGGVPFWAGIVITALRDERGKLIGFGKVTRDLSERKRAEEVLQEAYDQVNSVLDCTSDCVIKMNRDWKLTYGNRKAVESLADFSVGKDYFDCFPGVRSTEIEEILQTAMRERSNAAYETYYEPYQQWYRGNIFPTDDGLSLFFANITEEKALQQRVEREQLLKEKRIEALSHMAGGLAHEISNPLAIIHGKASDLLESAMSADALSPAEVADACTGIVKTAERAIRILRGLKVFGREANEDPMVAASFYEIVEQSLELQESRFNRHKVELRIALEPNIPLIECRETQIGQILTNLLNNAFDAVAPGDGEERWVQLSARRVDECLEVDVTDSGPGIEDKFKAHLMEPFFTTKEVGLGMGIGLSLSRAIAQEHGGGLTLRGESRHTRFRLILPIRQGAPA
jgi:PAS domain S-box-containing protein